MSLIENKCYMACSLTQRDQDALYSKENNVLILYAAINTMMANIISALTHCVFNKHLNLARAYSFPSLMLFTCK